MIFVFLATFLSVLMQMFVWQEVLDSSFLLSMQKSPDNIGRTKVALHKTCHYFITENYLVIFITVTCVCIEDKRILPNYFNAEQRYNLSLKDPNGFAFNNSSLSVVASANFAP